MEMEKKNRPEIISLRERIAEQIQNLDEFISNLDRSGSICSICGKKRDDPDLESWLCPLLDAPICDTCCDLEIAAEGMPRGLDPYVCDNLKCEHSPEARWKASRRYPNANELAFMGIKKDGDYLIIPPEVKIEFDQHWWEKDEHGNWECMTLQLKRIRPHRQPGIIKK